MISTFLIRWVCPKWTVHEETLMGNMCLTLSKVPAAVVADAGKSPGVDAAGECDLKRWQPYWVAISYAHKQIANHGCHPGGGGNGACSSKKKDQHMPLRVPPSAGRAAAGCTNCSTIVVKLCSEVLIYLPQKFWLDENINLPRRSGLYPDYQPFRRQFSKVFVSLIRIRVDVVPPLP